MKQYTEQEYKDKFGEQMWQDKVLATLTNREKRIGIDSVYATDMGNIFIINIKEEN